MSYAVNVMTKLTNGGTKPLSQKLLNTPGSKGVRSMVLMAPNKPVAGVQIVERRRQIE